MAIPAGKHQETAAHGSISRDFGKTTNQLRPFQFAGLLAVALVSVGSSAHAEDNAPVKSFRAEIRPIYQHATIRAISEDGGQTFAVPSGQEIKFGLVGKLDFRLGGADRAALFAGHCNGDRGGCKFRTKLWYGYGLSNRRDWNFSEIVTTTSERVLGLSSFAIANRCAELGASGSFTQSLNATLSVNTYTDHWPNTEFVGGEEADLDTVAFDGGDKDKHLTYQLQVECHVTSGAVRPTTPITPPNSQIGFDPGAMKVNDVRLTFTHSAMGTRSRRLALAAKGASACPPGNKSKRSREL